MAGSRRSPVLRDERRAAKELRDRDIDRDREREKGRDRNRERDHRPRFKQSGSGGRPRLSPPSRRGPPPDHDSAGNYRHSSPNAPAGRGPPAFHRNSQPSARGRSPPKRAFHPTRDIERSPPPGEKAFRRDSSAAPPPKRKRSLSPRASHRETNLNNHRPRHIESHRRGRPDNRGKPPSRDPFPRRSRKEKPHRQRGQKIFNSREEVGDSRPSTFPRSRSPHRRRSRSRLPHHSDFESGLHRPSSPHSVHSRGSRSLSPSRDYAGANRNMNSTKPIRSIVDDSTRPPTPPRPIPSFDADNVSDQMDGESRIREAFPMHGMRASDMQNHQRRGPPRPRVDTRQYTSSPQFVTPTSSYHGSPQSGGSPYSGGRGGWNGQTPFAGQHGHSPPYRQNSYQGTAQGQYYQGHQSQYSGPPMQQGYSGPPYRGGYRGNYHGHNQDRRFSAGSQNFSGPPSQRGGRGHFSNLQWTASGSRGRGDQHSPHGSRTQSGSNSPVQQSPFANENMSPEVGERDNSFRPSKELRVEDQESKPGSENGDAKNMPPPARQADAASTPVKEGGKFSFAFKSKTPTAPIAKPVPDLAQRMQVREPPPRPPEPPPRSRLSNGPPPKFKNDFRSDRRDRERDRDRDRDFHRGRHRDDRRDFRDRPDPRDTRRDDRRFDPREDRRRDDRRPDIRPERRRERTPEVKKPKKILKRMKPRPTLSNEFKESDSVYYRKPGNESVIGAGTYGKVFKAIHIYTTEKVALKRIRMEGEKDGFPVTAVREIKLLQYLRNHNVVSLLEVMVEKNECFMVFEYLSHDLTGLINHPTFTLSVSHKKDLAKQMFEGLRYLHHRGVLHRDIKAANILISNRGQLKFADFGLARFYSKSRQHDYTNRVITIWYRPPELLLGDTRYGPEVDIWSAACVFVEMFTKKAVFPGDGGEISQLDKLYNCLGTPTRAEWADIVDMPWFELMRPTERKQRVFEENHRDILSPAGLELVAQMFQYDPYKRPTADEVLAHPYFVSEEPLPQQAIELEDIEGDWHEFESKALRKEKDREARRAEQREKEKRKASASMSQSNERDAKRVRQDGGSGHSQ